jgi:hypothetical protein
MPLSKDLREFIEYLNSNRAEYLVNFIGRASLLRNKDATGRPKDRIDAEELRKQKPST